MTEYYASLLKTETSDQWSAEEALYISFDEFQIIKKVIEILQLKRRKDEQV